VFLSVVCDAVRPTKAMRLKESFKRRGDDPTGDDSSTGPVGDPNSTPVVGDPNSTPTPTQSPTTTPNGGGSSPANGAFDDADQLQAPDTWDIAMDSSGIGQIPADIRSRVYTGDTSTNLDWCVTQYLKSSDPADTKLHFQVSMGFCLEGEQAHIEQMKILFTNAFNEVFANCKNYVVKPKIYFTCGPLAHYSYTLVVCTDTPTCRSFNVEPIVPINIQLKYNPAYFGKPDEDCYVKYSIVHELLHRIYKNKYDLLTSLTHDGTGKVWQSPGANAIAHDGNIFHYSTDHFIPCKEHNAEKQVFIDEQVQSYWIMSCRDKLGAGALDNPFCYSV